MASDAVVKETITSHLAFQSALRFAVVSDFADMPDCLIVAVFQSALRFAVVSDLGLTALYWVAKASFNPL